MAVLRYSSLHGITAQGSATALGDLPLKMAYFLNSGYSKHCLQQAPDKRLGHWPLSLGRINRRQNAKPPGGKNLCQELAEVLSEAWVLVHSKPHISLMFPYLYNNYVLLL